MTEMKRKQATEREIAASIAHSQQNRFICTARMIEQTGMLFEWMHKVPISLNCLHVCKICFQYHIVSARHQASRPRFW